MKIKVTLLSLVHRLFIISILSVMAVLVGGYTARAGLTVDIHSFRYPGVFVSYGYLNTNDIAPAAPLGDYLISSPNGSQLQFRYDTNGISFVTGGGIGSSDFDSFMNVLTNGQWSIQVTNASSTNTYYFNVSATGLNEDLFNVPTITFPANNAQNVTNNPAFTWTGGPIGWLGTADVNVQDEPYNNYYENESLPPSATSWLTPNPPLPFGTNKFQLVYRSNLTATVIASVPRDSGSNAISGWVSTANLDVNPDEVQFVVGTGVAPAASLFGHYTFNDQFYLEEDSSGLTNHAAGMFWTGGGTQPPQYTATGIAGGAVEFDGENVMYWGANMVNVLSGSYSISLWLKTTQSYGSDDDDARNGAAIFTGNDSGDFPVPMALTGDKVGFHTAAPDHTINSTNSVNSGSFTHLVVTRDSATGLKRIYVDGVLDVSGTGGTAPGNDSFEVYLGYNYYSSQGIVGVVDDLQVYTGLLVGSQIEFLYNNPGATAPIISGGIGGHTNIAHYRFDDSGNIGLDDSGNDNHFNSGSSWGLPVHEFDPVGAAGAGGLQFYGVSSIVHAPPNPVFTNITSVLADSFSLSLWVKTEEVVGNDNDNAFDGAVVIWHFASNVDDNIPVSITGNKVAFHTGDEFGVGSTLHSTNDVTDGNYHHVVVTRDRISGVKQMYVDGVLEATETATTRLLDGNNNYFSIGGTINHDFTGTVDDVQIYSGVLSATEVTNLFNNPGTIAPNTVGGGNTNPPVDVEMQFSITRNQEFESGDVFYCFPSLTAVNISEQTEHRVESPNNYFDGGLNGGGSYVLSSLAEILTECTNGLWRLYINKGHASEQLFTFTVNITGLDTNLLKPVTIISPLNGSTNVSSSPQFTWSGPVGFNGIFAQKYETPFNNSVSTNLSGTATNWPSPPMLNAGTNRFYVSYHSNDVPHVTFSTPMDGSQPINSFIVTSHINSDATAQFIVSASGINPVQLANPNHAGGNFQFQFLSQAGKANTVQSRTNLTLGTWVNRTNILGDGNTKTVILPISSAPQEFFRVSTE